MQSVWPISHLEYPLCYAYELTIVHWDLFSPAIHIKRRRLCHLLINELYFIRIKIFLHLVVDLLFIVTPIVGVCSCSMFCRTLLYVHSSFAIILMWKWELVALLSLSSRCLVIVVRPFLAVSWFVCSLWLWYFLIIITIFVILNTYNIIQNILRHYIESEILLVRKGSLYEGVEQKQIKLVETMFYFSSKNN